MVAETLEGGGVPPRGCPSGYVGESCRKCGCVGHHARECSTPRGKRKAAWMLDHHPYNKGKSKREGDVGPRETSAKAKATAEERRLMEGAGRDPSRDPARRLKIGPDDPGQGESGAVVPNLEDNFIQNVITTCKIAVIKKGGSCVIEADFLAKDLCLSGRW